MMPNWYMGVIDRLTPEGRGKNQRRNSATAAPPPRLHSVSRDAAACRRISGATISAAGADKLHRMAAFGVESLLWLVVLPFVFTTSAFWLLRMLCTDGLAETRAFRRASAMAVAGLWLFYVYCAGAFAGCVAFPVLDFWRTPAWQENVNLVPFRQIVQYLLCLVPGRGYDKRRRVCVPRTFCLLDEPFRVFRSGSAAAAHLAPLAWGQSRAVAGRGRRRCDRDYTVVRAHGFRAFRFDVDAIILRVAGAVVFWWVGRIPAVKKIAGTFVLAVGEGFTPSRERCGGRKTARSGQDRSLQPVVYGFSVGRGLDPPRGVEDADHYRFAAR